MNDVDELYFNQLFDFIVLVIQMKQAEYYFIDLYMT